LAAIYAYAFSKIIGIDVCKTKQIYNAWPQMQKLGNQYAGFNMKYNATWLINAYNVDAIGAMISVMMMISDGGDGVPSDGGDGVSSDSDDGVSSDGDKVLGDGIISASTLLIWEQLLSDKVYYHTSLLKAEHYRWSDMKYWPNTGCIWLL